MGAGGLMLMLAGMGSGVLGLVFVVAPLVNGTVLAMRNDTYLPREGVPNRVDRREPSSPPLFEELSQGKRDSGRPMANHQ